MGRLKLNFPFRGEVADYRRDLDLAQGVARVQFSQGGTRYVREVFASHPDQAIVVRLTSDHPGKLTFRATLESQLRHAVTVQRSWPATSSEGGSGSVRFAANGLRLSGRAPVHSNPSCVGKRVAYDDAPDGKGMRFEGRLVASHEGGTLRFA